MPFLIACFMLFFGLAQLYPVVAGLDLSLPSWIVAGLLLAIASNYDKLIGDKRIGDRRIGNKPAGNILAGQGQNQPLTQSQAMANKTVEPASPTAPPPSASVPPSTSPSAPASKLMGKPRLDLPTRPPANAPAKPSISFTIPKQKSS